MSRVPDERYDRALDMYHKGARLKEIAAALGLSEGTVRSWKKRNEWDCNATQRKTQRNAESDAIRRIKAETAKTVNPVIENPNLTDKQRLFCLKYIRCFNATKAYQKAYGCGYDVASVGGYDLLRNPKVAAEILRLKQERLNREFFSEHDIFQKYMDIAFADITEYLEFGRETVPVMGAFGPVMVDDDLGLGKVPLMKEVNTVRFRESSEVDGTLLTEVKQGKDGASIKLADRMKALDWLTDHMDLATDLQKAQIDALRSKTAESAGTGEDITFNVLPASQRPDDKGGDPDD